MRNKAQQDQTPNLFFEPEQGAFSIVQAAAYCGVRCAAVEDAVRDGRLLGRRFGRNIVIRKIDLDSFLASLDVIPVHTPPSILKRRQERSQGKVTAYVFADRQARSVGGESKCKGKKMAMTNSKQQQVDHLGELEDLLDECVRKGKLTFRIDPITGKKYYRAAGEWKAEGEALRNENIS